MTDTASPEQGQSASPEPREPVAEVRQWNEGQPRSGGYVFWLKEPQGLPVGTKLFAAAPQGIPQGVALSIEQVQAVYAANPCTQELAEAARKLIRLARGSNGGFLVWEAAKALEGLIGSPTQPAAISQGEQP